MAFLAPFIPQIAGAVAMGGMGIADQKAQEEGSRQDKLDNALETQYSPWLGTNYKQVRRPGSAVGSILGGAFQGAMMGNNLSKGFGNSSWGGMSKMDIDPGMASQMDTSKYTKPSFKSPWGNMNDGQTRSPFSNYA